MTNPKPLSDKEIKQLRSLVVYKEISKVKNVETVLREGYAYWRRLAEEASVNAQGSENYLRGRADSWEEIQQLILNAKHHGEEEN